MLQMENIGTIIRSIREEKKLKQEYVAFCLGISINAYANMENNRSRLNTNRLEELADLFEMKSSAIIKMAEDLSPLKDKSIQKITY